MNYYFSSNGPDKLGYILFLNRIFNWKMQRNDFELLNATTTV